MNELVIPAGTIVAEGHANESFQCLRIPDTVERLGNDAFANCTDLETVYFGSNIKSGGSRVFYNCKNIKKVYVKSIADLFNYRCDNYGSPLQYGANLYVDGTLCTEVVIPADAKDHEILFPLLGCGSIKKIKVRKDTPCYDDICAMVDDMNNHKDKFRYFVDGDVQDIKLEDLN